MNLTSDQQSALVAFEAFLQTAETVFLLQSSAGCGKTFLVQYINHVLNEHHMTAVGVAPTHKAKRVLRERMAGKEVVTLASLLLKMRKHSYIGARAFEDGSDERARAFSKTCFVLDEVSMVSDSDFRALERAAQASHNRILAIGDPFQIPAISQNMFAKEDGVLRRRKCVVFLGAYAGTMLLQTVRQVDSSPILRVAGYVRDHIHADFSLRVLFPEFILAREDAYAIFRDTACRWSIKILAYTNEAVESHNRAVRGALECKQPFEKGEILMGYQNIGYPVLVVENGADYQVVSAVAETNGMRKRMVGWTVRVAEVPNGTGAMFFFPDVGAPANKATLAKLVELSRKVNLSHSSKKDYAIYRSLKDKLLFLQNLYEYPVGSEMFFTSTQLKQKEPLLFTPVADVICQGKAMECELYENLKLLYGDLVDQRISDDKALVDSETFASSFCVLEKDLDYGYACTSHKSQGSSLHTVFVDEANFDKMRNRLNARFGMLEDIVTDRNRLKYVAVTRATDHLHLLV